MESNDSDNIPECSHGPITSKNNALVPEKNNLPEKTRPACNTHARLVIIPKELPEKKTAGRDENATKELLSSSVHSIEIATHLYSGNPEQTPSASQSNVAKRSSNTETNPKDQGVPNSILPFLLNCKDSVNKVITTQPLGKSSMPSSSLAQPPSLFIQALSKVNENSLGLSAEAFMSRLGHLLGHNFDGGSMKSDDLQAPDSLTSAPPSYSFVLRQSNARSRRPRLMGTFIPSPSFITHTPPPNYATAFDIYVDNVPPPPVQVYNYGFTPMHVVCPECGFAGLTVVDSRITLCTHLCAVILCLFCCWICVPLPYIMRSCKDVYHYCRQCSNYLGMYCPTNPENAQRQHFEVNRRRNVSPRRV